MSPAISVNILQALGEKEWKLKIELPRLASNRGGIPGSNGELERRGRYQLSTWKIVADMYVSQGSGGTMEAVLLRSQACQALGPMAGLACKGRS